MSDTPDTTEVAVETPSETGGHDLSALIDQAFADLPEDPVQAGAPQGGEAGTETAATGATRSTPERGPDGRFVSTKSPAEMAVGATETPIDPQKAAEGEKPADQPSDGSDNPPPAWMSDEARALWNEAPAELRDEMMGAIETLKDAYNEANELASAVPAGMIEDCKQQGKPVSDIINFYYSMDKNFAADPVGTIQGALSRIGISPQQVGAALAGIDANTDVASVQTAMQQKDLEIQNLKNQLQQEQSTRQSFEATQREQEQARALATIDAFFAAHPDAQNYQPQMTRLMQTGVVDRGDLAGAYRLAATMAGKPVVTGEALPPQAQPAPQSMAAPSRASLAIAGAPSQGQTERSSPNALDLNAVLDHSFAVAGLH